MWTRTTGALALTGLLCAAAPAAAFVRTTTSTGHPVYWNRTVMYLRIYAGDPPGLLSAQEVAQAARGAAAAWSWAAESCTSIDLRVSASAADSAPTQPDSESAITFRRDEWCKQPHEIDQPCYDSSALAVTSVFARKTDGKIVDADVELNAVDFAWSDLVARPEDAADAHDLQNALTHELGHFIGLDHTCQLDGSKKPAVDDRGDPVPSCGEATAENAESTMFPAVLQGDLDRRSLAPDDRRALCSIYPALDGVLAPEAALACATAGSDPRHRGARTSGAALFAACALLLRRALRSRR
jgi:hypothetical protein